MMATMLALKTFLMLVLTLHLLRPHACLQCHAKVEQLGLFILRAIGLAVVPMHGRQCLQK